MVYLINPLAEILLVMAVQVTATCLLLGLPCELLSWNLPCNDIHCLHNLLQHAFCLVYLTNSSARIFPAMIFTTCTTCCSMHIALFTLWINHLESCQKLHPLPAESAAVCLLFDLPQKHLSWNPVCNDIHCLNKLLHALLCLPHESFSWNPTCNDIHCLHKLLQHAFFLVYLISP